MPTKGKASIAKKTSAVKAKPGRKPSAKKAKASPAKKTTAKKKVTAAKKPTAAKKSTAAKKVGRKPAAKKVGRKPAVKKAGRKPTAKKTVGRPAKKATKPAAKKVGRKPAAKKTTAKRGPAKRKTAKAKTTTAKAAKPKKAARGRGRTKSVKKKVAEKEGEKKPAPQRTKKTTKSKSAGGEHLAQQIAGAGKPIAKTSTKKKMSPKKTITKNSAPQPASEEASTTHQHANDESSELSQLASESIGMSVLGIEPYVMKQDESYMNDEQLDHFRKILLKRKQLLMEEVDQTVAQMRFESTYNPADINDRATLEEMLSLQLRERNREGKLLKKIEEALDKIDRHEYGYCDICGIEIGVRRLEARPTAVLCIDCKTLDEIKERQQGG